MEGVNSDFKTFFTKRKRLSMKCAIEIIGECIVYYSENAVPFALNQKYSPKHLNNKYSINEY